MHVEKIFSVFFSLIVSRMYCQSTQGGQLFRESPIRGLSLKLYRTFPVQAPVQTRSAPLVDVTRSPRSGQARSVLERNVI